MLIESVVRHLEEMRSYATSMPAVNQTELSPFFQVGACRFAPLTYRLGTLLRGARKKG
jgi:diketogulonate reductase-like aldo/keto reductase